MSEQTLQTLTWLIPAGPLLVFFLIVLFTRNNRTLSWMLAWAGVIASLVMGWIVAFNLFGEDVHHLAEHPVLIHSAIDWIPIGAFSDGNWFEMGVAVDPLTAVMLFMVPFAVFMIFIYSVGYHNFGQPPGHHLGEPNHGKEEPLFRSAVISVFTRRRRHSQRNGFVVHAEAAGEETETAVTSSSYSGV